MEKNKIFFVYNADSGLLNSARDYLHKIVSPKTYNCNLCAITYGSTGMNDEWKRFIKEIPFPYEFLHKDELAKKFQMDVKLPVIFLKTGEEIKTILTAQEINKCKTATELINLIKEKV